MRKFHKMALARSLIYPPRCVFLDTETTTLQDDELEHRPKLIYGFAEYIELDKHLTASEIDGKEFLTVKSFWDWLEPKFNQPVDLWIFAHNWGFDFPVINGFNQMVEKGYELISIVDGCPPVILRYRKEKSIVIFIDTLNFFKSSLAQMGKAIGLEKMEIEFDGKVTPKLKEYCQRDVEILRRSMLELMSYLKTNKLCKLNHTISSLALNTYNRNFQPCPIYIDGQGDIDNPDTTINRGVSMAGLTPENDRSEYARKSYFGGRTEAFKLGEFEGPFYLIDVNSQYPFVMRNSKFPYKTIGRYKHVNLPELTAVIREHCVIAHVQISTDKPVFPVYLNKRTCFPIGRYEAYLTTPEIAYGLDHDMIEKVHSYILYEAEFLFRDYVDYFYQQKAKYKQSGNLSWSILAKYMLNTLYGKFAQTYKKWEKTDMKATGTPHTGFYYDYDKGIREYTMELNGQVFAARHGGESRDSFPAISSHVTAGGRLIIQRMIDYLGIKNVFYCDTDSLLINQTGMDLMENKTDQWALGAWSLDAEYENINIRGCKDYKFDNKERIKGIKAGAERVEQNIYRQLQFASLSGVIRSKIIDSPLIKRIHKQLKREYMKGYVSDSGIITPFVLDDGEIVSKG